MILIFLVSQLFADTVNFCFDRSVNIEYAKKELSSISAPSDQIDLRRGPHCLEVTVHSNRVSLFEKYLRRLYGTKVRLNNSLESVPEIESDLLPSRHCKIEVEQVKSESSQKDNYSIGSSNTARRYETDGTSTSKSQMILANGRSGKLSVNGRTVALSCQPRGQKFQLEISIQESSGGVETSLTVQAGEKINLGDIVDQFEKSGKLLDINSGAGYSKEKGQIKSDYYLTVQ